MKTFISLFLFISNILFSQYIEGINVTQNGTNQIKVHSKAYFPTSASGYISYDTNTVVGLITLNACYYMSPLGGDGATTHYENDFYIDVPANASYTLKVNMYISTDEFVCNYNRIEDTAILNFSTPIQGTVSLGLTDVSGKNKELTLFPNPVKNILNVKSSSKITQLSVYDAAGKQVYKISSPKENQIDVSKLESGIYFIEGVSASKKWREKFVKK